MDLDVSGLGDSSSNTFPPTAVTIASHSLDRLTMPLFGRWEHSMLPLLRGFLLTVCHAFLIVPVLAETSLSSLTEAPQHPLSTGRDWLIDDSNSEGSVYRSKDEKSLILDNGLVRRTIRLVPNAATVGLHDLRTGANLLRSVRPEAIVVVDGKTLKIGGLSGQPDHAYLTPAWIDSLREDPDSLQLTGWEIVAPEKPFEWKRVRHAEDRPWPPKGKGVLLHFEPKHAEWKGLKVSIRHEIYDGVPVLSKSLVITNGTDRKITIDSLTTEILAAVEGESAVDSREPGQWRRPPIDVLSDYMFHGMDVDTANRVANWAPDPEYTTQVSYNLQTPCLLVCKPPIGPGKELVPGESLNSFRVYLIAQDSSDRERQGLTVRRTWRTIAPWTTENPLMMHVLGSNKSAFRKAVDQCAAVGFEMIIHTFGSGLNMENTDPGYIAKIKEDVDYAHAKGIHVGGYSLFSSRSIDAENDVINPATGKPGGAIFGNAPCFASHWGQEYEKKIKRFIEQTGFDLLEHDGPYPGDPCASTSHPGHRGLADSQWVQWEMSRGLYAWCREHGVYVNQPDCYFLAGGNKTGMGYRETNWSLPREQQIIHARQHIYDGTWNKTVSMGWMFVPLTQYHGGGQAATIEPLHKHLPAYEAQLAANLGAGVQACWRGPRLYDTDETKELVQRWVTWFKKYRDILESDVIHGRRPDGQDVDFIVHVNPKLRRKGLVAIYNPLTEPVTRTIRIPLYYTGLVDVAKIRQEEAEPKEYKLDRAGFATVDVTIKPSAMTWLVVE